MVHGSPHGRPRTDGRKVLKAFAISRAAIAGMVTAAIADERARALHRHGDTHAPSRYVHADGPCVNRNLLSDGAEPESCARRVAALFDVDTALLAGPPRVPAAEWAGYIQEKIENRMEYLSFRSAVGKGQECSCVHRAGDLYQDGAAVANFLHGRKRLVSFVASHSLLGFVLSVLVPALLGLQVLDARHLSPETLSRSLGPGDVLVGTPSCWRHLVREVSGMPGNVTVLSFGEPMPAELAVKMRKCSSGIFKEVYGSTETGLVAWRDAPSDPFTLFAHWHRDDRMLARTGPSGTRKSASSMDILEWVDNRRFFLSGRKDGAVQIGAVNVLPGHVRRVLCDHEKVADCAVVAGTGNDGVSRLVANILLERGVSPGERTARDIDVWCRQRLLQHERPRIYNFMRRGSAPRSS